jgi:hypothetical protein
MHSISAFRKCRAVICVRITSAAMEAAALDVILWNNELHVVRNGFSFSNSSSTSFGRLVLIENAINLASNTSGLASTAIAVSGNGSAQTFGVVICRKQVIAKDPASVGGTNTLIGISINNATDVIAENSIINDCDSVTAANALNFNYCGNFKPFNNQKSGGFLLHAYDTANARFKLELQDALEDALMGF